MSVPSKYWKYYLTQTSTGLAYYIDLYGNMQPGNVMSGKDLSLPEDPDGWEDIQLTYARNQTYWGLNRSFTIPLKFVGDGARILRKLFYLGKGIEQPVTLVVLKWDETYGAFMPYYKGQLDLTACENLVASQFTCNVMEGGILQLLKSYENSIIEIPCDGSIPENIKILADGIKFADTFHYQILKLSTPYAGDQPLPCVFLSNDGDNIGIIHGDQNLDQPYDQYYQKSSNFIFSSSSTPTSVRITGSISIRSDPNIHNTQFYLYAATSLSQPRGVGGVDHAVGLVTPQIPAAGGFFIPSQSSVLIDGQRTFSFDATIDLAVNENLFIFFFNDFASNAITILGGSFDLSFNSQLAPSRVWAITAANAWKILGQELCVLASTTDYPFEYLFTSEFLQGLERIVLTSGDAIRASTNPNYYQYYNLATLNPQNPNNTQFNQFSSLGPVIKLCIADLFNSLNPIKPSSIGNQPDENGNDSIFFEDRLYVLDDSAVTLALPQVNNFKITANTDDFFNWLQIGYSPNSYDETSGKYEYNNSNSYQAPVKSIAKVLTIMSKKGRTDSYGFEFTRYNTQGGKSTTFNSSDSDWWFLDVDFNGATSFDYYRAFFTSSIQNTASLSNTNILLQRGLNYQPVIVGQFDGDYFTNNNDFSIFMFNQPSPGTLAMHVSFSALLNGVAGDGCTLNMIVNGGVVQQWSLNVSSVNTVFEGTLDSSRAFSLGDNIYFTISTVRTCTVQINSMTLNIGGGYFICSNAGPINIQAGSVEQLIPLGVITADTVVVDGNTIQVVSYGFQYFRFLSAIHNTGFNWDIALGAFIQGAPSEFITLDLWKNGFKIGEVIYNGTTIQSTINVNLNPQFSGTVNLTNYDTYWLTASCTNLNAWIFAVNFLFTSTSIEVYPLLREAYSAVSGIPNPETAFNITDFTPARMLRANGGMLRAMLLLTGQGPLVFQTADKNAFLSTTLNGVTITENANIDLHTLDDPWWLPLLFEFDTMVPYTAKQIFDASANGYISFIWKGKTFYGFPMQVTIKPALNDSQSWKLLAAPANLLADLVELEWDGLPILSLMDVYIPYINGVQFVPLNFTKAARYNTYTMDEDWLVNRIKDYCDKNNYFAPWQQNDTIPLQCQTAGLSPVVLTVLNHKGQPIGVSVEFDEVVTAALIAPQVAYQANIVLAALPPGKYYFQWSMGTGTGTAIWISEGIWIKQYWPKTQLYESTNSRNKLGCIFQSATPFISTIRMFSQINKYTPKSVFTTFVDEPQDINLLNAIPFDTWNLDLGFGSGMPDYMLQKFERVFDLDTVMIDGNQYSRDADAQVDVTYIDGQAKAYMKLAIRRAKNQDGVTLNTAGQIEGPQQAGYVIDASAFGQSSDGQNLIQVSNS